MAAGVASGRLIALLEPGWPRFDAFHLDRPSRLDVPRNLRAFIEFMQARLRAPWAPRPSSEPTTQSRPAS